MLGSANTVNNPAGPRARATWDSQREAAEGHGRRAEEIAAFVGNKQYNLTLQTRLVASLDALEGVTGRPEFVAQAAGATTTVDARFDQEGADMAETYHRTKRR